MYIASYDENKSGNYFFDKQRDFFRKKGFTWCAYLFAYGKDKKIYKDLENNWSDIDSITGKSIAFVIVDEVVSNRVRNGKKIKRAQYLPKHDEYSISQSNVSIIEEGIIRFGFKRSNIPCLVLTNLIYEYSTPVIIELIEDVDLSSIMSFISIRTKESIDAINMIKNELSRGYRAFEDYANMCGTLLEVIQEINGDNREVKELLDDLSNPYSIQRLLDIWNELTYGYPKKIYKDSPQSRLPEKIIKARFSIRNFDYKRSHYYELVNKMNIIQTTMYNDIKNINILECHIEVMKYIFVKSKELTSILQECNISKEITDKIENSLYTLQDAEKINVGSIQQFKDAIKNLETSVPARVLDDIGRIIMIENILMLLLKWLLSYIL